MGARVTALACVSEDWGIGKSGQLLYHIKPDLERFRWLTTGQIVIMGRKTLESLPAGRPLPSRSNWVLSRTMGKTPGVKVISDLTKLDKLLAKEKQAVYIVGGEEIYKLLLSRCQYANLTVVKAMRPADSFFPNLDRLPEWRQIGNSPVRIDEATGLEYQFVRYKKFEDVL